MIFHNGQKRKRVKISRKYLKMGYNFGILNRKQMGQTLCHSKEPVELKGEKFSCGLIEGLPKFFQKWSLQNSQKKNFLRNGQFIRSIRVNPPVKNNPYLFSNFSSPNIFRLN